MFILDQSVGDRSTGNGSTVASLFYYIFNVKQSYVLAQSVASRLYPGQLVVVPGFSPFSLVAIFGRYRAFGLNRASTLVESSLLTILRFRHRKQNKYGTTLLR